MAAGRNEHAWSALALALLCLTGWLLTAWHVAIEEHLASDVAGSSRLLHDHDDHHHDHHDHHDGPGEDHAPHGPGDHAGPDGLPSSALIVLDLPEPVLELAPDPTPALLTWADADDDRPPDPAALPRLPRAPPLG